MVFPLQGELVDYSVHLLPAGLAAASGEVVPWKPRLQGQIMVGVTVAVEGSRDFKVCTIHTFKVTHMSPNSAQPAKLPPFSSYITLWVCMMALTCFLCVYIHRTFGVLYY